MLSRIAALLLTTTSTLAVANTSVTMGNQLGLDLAREHARLSPSENFMVSPLSLQQALALAANGAASSTRAALEEKFLAPLATINQESSELVSQISFSKQQRADLIAANRWANPSVVSVSNSIWYTNGLSDGARFEFSEALKETAQKFYAAGSQTEDFRQPEAAEALNAWAKEKTYGLVPKIIDAEALAPMLWVVMNATYVEASWAQPFGLSRAEFSPEFTLLTGKKVRVPMITGAQRIDHAVLEDGTQLAAIPFSQEPGAPALEFVAILPPAEKPFALFQEEFFLGETWSVLQKALKDSGAAKKVTVTLPKFSFDTSISLKKDEPLTMAMDLNFLYQDSADFSLLGTPESQPTKVGLIKQNSRIELDEKGVKAAAVTVVGGFARTSIELPPETKFLADRPFLFAITEKSTGAILFVGSVLNPL